MSRSLEVHDLTFFDREGTVLSSCPRPHEGEGYDVRRCQEFSTGVLECAVVPGASNGKSNTKGLDVDEQPAGIRAKGGSGLLPTTVIVGGDVIPRLLQDHIVLCKGEDLLLGSEPYKSLPEAIAVLAQNDAATRADGNIVRLSSTACSGDSKMSVSSSRRGSYCQTCPSPAVLPSVDVKKMLPLSYQHPSSLVKDAPPLSKPCINTPCPSGGVIPGVCAWRGSSIVTHVTRKVVPGSPTILLDTPWDIDYKARADLSAVHG
jgi:hypothetical protein